MTAHYALVTSMVLVGLLYVILKYSSLYPGYYDTHPIVEWFWEVVQSFDNEKRLRLLQVTQFVLMTLVCRQ